MSLYKIDATTAYFVCPSCGNEFVEAISDLKANLGMIFVVCSNCGSRTSLLCHNVPATQNIQPNVLSRHRINHSLMKRLITAKQFDVNLKTRKVITAADIPENKYNLAIDDEIVEAVLHAKIAAARNAKKVE